MDQSTKKCSSCKEQRPLDLFGKRKDAPDGLHYVCKPCALAAQRAKYADDPEHREAVLTRWQRYRDAKGDEWDRQRNRSAKLRINYGLTDEAYAAMLAEQGGVCAICGSPPDNERKKHLAVDHCHETDKVRGLLCDRCNVGLGNFRDDPAKLQAAIEYLHRNT